MSTFLVPSFVATFLYPQPSHHHDSPTRRPRPASVTPLAMIVKYKTLGPHLPSCLEGGSWRKGTVSALGTGMWYRDKLRIYSMIESICDHSCQADSPVTS